MGSELFHRNQWRKLVGVMGTSLQELPRALQRCRDECYGPLRLGRRMGFAQVLFVLACRQYWAWLLVVVMQLVLICCMGTKCTAHTLMIIASLISKLYFSTGALLFVLILIASLCVEPSCKSQWLRSLHVMHLRFIQCTVCFTILYFPRRLSTR